MREAGTTTDAERRRRGRPKTATVEDRRAVIIERAFDAFVDLGFAGATTDVIAARAQVSKREIYNRFGGKTELFAAVVLKHRDLVLDLPRPAGEDMPLLDALATIFRLDMDWRRDVEREALLHLITRESVLYPELSDYLYDQGILRFREELVAWIGAQAACGRLVVDDPVLCAGLLMDIVFGALLPRRRQLGDNARAQRKQDIKRRLAIVLRGLGASDA